MSNRVAARLKRLANYIDESEKPSFSTVRTELASIMRSSGLVKNVVNKEVNNTVSGLDALLQKMEKITKYVNPNDPSRAKLEESLRNLFGLKQELNDQFNGFKNISI